MTAIRDRRPLAFQVRDHIQALIAEDHLARGDQLPTEVELATRFSVARTTIREAFKLLEQDGQIDVRHGLGRFVAQAAVQWPITRLESVTEMIQAMGSAVTNRVISVAAAAATDEEAEALHLAPGSRVVRLERVRSVDSRPIIYSVDVIAGSVIGNDLTTVDWTGSLQILLAARGVAMATATAQIRAVMLPHTIATAIEADRRAPWLLMIQTHTTSDGQAVLYSHDYHRGDAFTFNVLRRSGGAATT
jgi:GntR family transcriptional regulator